MLQNKIYHNYIFEIFKLFLVILFSLAIIAWTVRAVNFLDLIVESGYPILTYFQYSFLNLFENNHWTKMNEFGEIDIYRICFPRNGWHRRLLNEIRFG